MLRKGMQMLNDPFKNKGTAFTIEERKKYGLLGLLPSCVRTIEEQADEIYRLYQSKNSRIEQRHLLMEVFNTNRTLFFYLMEKHIAEFMPVVYDPVIAEAIEQYNERYIKPQDAAYLSIEHPDLIKEELADATDGRDIRLIVVTDEKLLKSANYLGNRIKRVEGQEYFDFIDKFVDAVEELFPKSLLHFEDFGRGTAAQILDKYQDKILTFNDDIQGTGIIALAGVLGAMNISKEKLTDQTFLTFGAGTAGMGIAKMLYDELIRQGLTPEEAKKHFYLVDKQGLLFDDTPGLTPKQKPFTRQRSEFANADELTNLLAVVKAVHPTVMIGTSTQPGSFDEAVVKEMAAHTSRPVIFPLSNPTKLAEAKAADLLKWTDGKALIATGIPVKDIEYNGTVYQIGQANNALIYPGVGFGALAAEAKVLNDNMLAAAAHALSGLVDPEKPGAAVLPPVSKLTEFSKRVAERVAESAIDQGLAGDGITDAKKAVAEKIWKPQY